LSTISTRLPAWLQRHGMTGLCLFVVLLITLSLSEQSVEFLRLLRSQPPSAPPASASSQQPGVSIERLQHLFGVPARAAGTQNAPPTRQQMILLASFVTPHPERSTAIIQAAGDKPKRVAVGERVNASTRLQAVHHDHVVLDRGGHEESLNFPAVRSPTLTASSSPGPAAEQLQQLQDEDVQALQQRIQTLQQRMEGDGAPPMPETPDTEDSP
jgi:general secretion pathway protein C